MTQYHIRREEIKGIALGPNEFNALRVQLMRTQRCPWGDVERLANATELQFEGFCIYCAPRVGVQVLLDGRWDVQVSEARKYFSLEGLDS